MKQTSTEALQPLGYPISKDPQPSSDDFIVDDGLFNDVEMQDAPGNLAPEVLPNVTSNFPDTTMAFSESNESLEDVYQSAPDSPSKVNTLSRTASMRKQRQSAVKSPIQVSQCHGPSETTFGQGRKRAHPAQPKPDLPRKVSRDSSSNRSFCAIPNQPFGSIIHTAPYPQTTKVDDPSIDDGLVQRSFSSDSFTSVTSSGAIYASSACTTPNTSFRTGTPGTSFDSINEPFELDNSATKSMHTSLSWPRLDGPFGPGKPSGLGLNISLDPSMHHSVKAVSMGPPALIPTSRISPVVSVKNLLSISPFGKSLNSSPRHPLIESKPPRAPRRTLSSDCGIYTRCAACQPRPKSLWRLLSLLALRVSMTTRCCGRHLV